MENKNFLAQTSLSENSSKEPSIFLHFIIKNIRTYPRRTIWSFVMLLCFVGCIFKIQKFFSIYFSYPVIVSLQGKQNFVSQFPAVTVCNVNRIRFFYSYCKNKDIKQSDCQFGDDRIDGIPEMILSERLSIISCSTAKNKSLEKNTLSQLEFLEHYLGMDKENQEFVGHKKSDMIKHCSFNRQSCSYLDFELFQSLRYGNCFTFNKNNHSHKDQFKSFESGYFSGLELLIDLQLDMYTDRKNVTQNIGIVVVVHDPNEIPNPNNKGNYASPGFETSISVKENVFERLPAPYRDHCVNYPFSMDQNSEEECMQNCLQELNYKECGCIDPTINISPALKHSNYCDLKFKKDICCLDGVQDHIESSCNCPLSCYSVSYDVELSRAIFPSKAAHSIQYGKKYEEDFEYFQKSFILLRVFHSTLTQSVYSQRPMFEDSEICRSMGGELGIWLGISLFSVFEIIEAAVYLCKKLTSK